MKMLFVAVMSFLLAGCGDGLQRQVLGFNESFGPTFPVANDGVAALYIMREAAPPDAQAIVITIGGVPLGGLTGPDYMRLDLPPKLYDLRAYGTQANNELIITVAPGQTRFLLAQATPSGSAELLELSQEQGRRLARQGQRMWTPQLD